MGKAQRLGDIQRFCGLLILLHTQRGALPDGVSSIGVWITALGLALFVGYWAGIAYRTRNQPVLAVTGRTR